MENLMITNTVLNSHSSRIKINSLTSGKPLSKKTKPNGLRIKLTSDYVCGSLQFEGNLAVTQT